MGWSFWLGHFTSSSRAERVWAALPDYIGAILARTYINTLPESESGDTDRLLSVSDWKVLRPRLKKSDIPKQINPTWNEKRGGTRPPKAGFRPEIELPQALLKRELHLWGRSENKARGGTWSQIFQTYRNRLSLMLSPDVLVEKLTCERWQSRDSKGEDPS